MREKIILFVRRHPVILNCIYDVLRCFFNFISLFIPKTDTILFSSYGGRKLDDSPYELYKEIIRRKEFDKHEIVWAFVNPDQFEIPRGIKVKIDTPAFFKTLLKARIWISNTGIDRDIGISKRGHISVETWHGCPLKKICGEENTGSVSNNKLLKRKQDTTTIRCAQGEYDLEIYSRVFNSSRETFLMCDLPRNDILAKGISEEEQIQIKKNIGIIDNRKVVLYMPTFREYSLDKNNNICMAPPLNMEYWKEKLSEEYVLLIRAHYAVTKVMKIVNDGFTYDVSDYPSVNDLYFISDILISDYSSSYIDYSILQRPMLCYAYDLEEYTEKRGLYIDLAKELPCPIDKDESALIEHLENMDYMEYSEKSRLFHEKYSSHAGNATNAVINEIISRNL